MRCQVHCELLYEPVPELEALGSEEGWSFRDSGGDLDQWVERLTSDSAWTVICGHRPSEVRVSYERAR